METLTCQSQWASSNTLKRRLTLPSTHRFRTVQFTSGHQPTLLTMRPLLRLPLRLLPRLLLPVPVLLTSPPFSTARDQASGPLQDCTLCLRRHGYLRRCWCLRVVFCCCTDRFLLVLQCHYYLSDRHTNVALKVLVFFNLSFSFSTRSFHEDCLIIGDLRSVVE